MEIKQERKNNYELSKNKILKKLVDLGVEIIGEEKIDALEEIGLFEIAQDSIKILKVCKDFNEKYQIYKIKKMLEKISEGDLVKLDNTDSIKFLKRLFIVINNIDFEEKIDYLSELYCLYAKQEITEIEFFRCCKILENSSYLDINDFEDKCYNLDMENGRLYLGIGLLEEDYSYRGKLTTHNESVLLKKTKVGEIFQKIKILIKN